VWRDWVDQVVVAFGLRAATHVRAQGRTSAQVAVRALRHPAFSVLGAHLTEGLTVRPLTDPVTLSHWHALWNTATAHPALNRTLELIHSYARAHHRHRPTATARRPPPGGCRDPIATRCGPPADQQRPQPHLASRPTGVLGSACSVFWPGRV
jgi:hypothetical protein